MRTQSLVAVSFICNIDKKEKRSHIAKWEKAFDLFMSCEATFLSNGKKTAVGKAESRARGIRYLLSQMPDLANKQIERITYQVWMDSLRAYTHANYTSN